MTIENFERMEGLVKIKAMTQLENAIRDMSIDLVAEGFDDNEIKEFFERIVGFVVDDVTDPL